MEQISPNCQLQKVHYSPVAPGIEAGNDQSPSWPDPARGDQCPAAPPPPRRV